VINKGIPAGNGWVHANRTHICMLHVANLGSAGISISGISIEARKMVTNIEGTDHATTDG